MSSTTAGNQQITVTTESSSTCTPSTGLGVTLTSKQLGSGKSSLKFSSAGFYIDKGVPHKHKVKIKLKGKGKGKGKKHKTKTVFKTVYGPNATARKLPASETLSIKGLKAGTHTLTVKVHFKQTKKTFVGHGKHKHKVTTTITVTKTIKAKFKVC